MAVVGEMGSELASMAARGAFGQALTPVLRASLGRKRPEL